MSHVEHDTLWSLSRGELDAAQTQAAKAHLAQCPDCRVSYEDVQLATQVLMDLPAVPPMPDAMARRVGAELAEAADARAARRFTSWWQSLFTPRFAFAAAFGLGLAITGAWLLAGANPEPAPVALPTPAPTPVEAPAAKKLAVTVASAKKATAQRAQVLAEGTRISTQKGGSLWMKLPDGSRAGLTATSEVKLETLEEKRLTLDLERGSLAMVVPHRQDRVLTVRAGDLVVKDLGTRFLVSREANRTLVAVEEGEVEVTTPAGKRVVKADRAVSWSDGKLVELPWETAPQPATVTQAVVQPVADPSVPPTPDIAPPPDSVARLAEQDEADDDAPPPPAEAVVDAPPDRTPVPADEQWAQLPKASPPPPPSGATPPKATAVTASERGFSLRKLERKLRELGVNITTPDRREAGVRNIALTADAGDCGYALRLADAWLRQPAPSSERELVLRRAVQVQQVRCLNHLGRNDEASAIERTLEITK